MGNDPCRVISVLQHIVNGREKFEASRHFKPIHFKYNLKMKKSDC